MKIVNIMLAKGKGGIEQAFLDYSLSLKKLGVEIIAIISPNAYVKQELINNNILYYEIGNFGWWDFIAILKLHYLLKKIQPAHVITHAGRASFLAAKARYQGMHHIAVAHNYSIKQLIYADAIFSITNHLKNYINTNYHYPKEKIHIIPNMLETDNFTLTPITFHQPITFGAMGRFVEKKRFDVFIRAIGVLNKMGIKCNGVIAGDGEESENLHNLVNELNLQDNINFVGWIKDKQEFFDKFDIFCHNSMHEPFGIVVIEAMLYGKAAIVSDTEGPSEIIQDNINGLLYPKGMVSELVEKMMKLTKNQQIIEDVRIQAFTDVLNKYNYNSVGTKILKALGTKTK
jgi:glycosyltransferase involved in cell wall biosynthesis